MNYEHEIKKLEAQIEEAKAQIKVLKAVVDTNQEAPPVWVPDRREEYFTVDGDWVEVYRWIDDFMDKASLALGEVFRTQKEAESHLRALKLVETIRRERFKAQGKWWPIEGEARYTICWYWLAGRVDIAEPSCVFPLFAFGFWRDRDVLHGVVKKHESELLWYFNEYLPSTN